MKIQLISILILFVVNGYGQTFVTDSMINNQIGLNLAHQKFVDKGREKNGERVGEWIDYVFGSIDVFYETDDDVNLNRMHILICQKGKYQNGKKTGLWNFYGIEPGTYKEIKLCGAIYRDDMWNGTMIHFYPTGGIACTGKYVNGLHEGEWTYYYKNKDLARKQSYAGGNLAGIEYEYYHSGELKRVNNFSTGIDQYYYPGGDLWCRRILKNGEVFNILELYDKEGKPLDYGTVKDGTGTVKFYDRDGKVYLIITYKDGVKMSEEKF